MATKRKFDGDCDDAIHQHPKQLKLVPFPNYEDNDCMMSEAEPYSHHNRNTSSASSDSSNASGSPTTPPATYPSVEPYALSLIPDVSMSGVTVIQSSSTSMSNVGLLQPHLDFKHHGNSCTTIPKLRIACSPGLNGQRTMWSHCSTCGAIAMVNCD
ncbi:hypothetical protein BT96DRAFT_880223 [Gymnopus androsaceus JB14]|uniref:Uncharacterized protein n=1 Tax=Gymnopus androsaceus JB14 TaxID=1447944 RepID=A0A6A4HRA2_9AGAR|nr:hypothetical protein BT96DRAFT_880223 [Gymnopus androsaceus JB14]